MTAQEKVQSLIGQLIIANANLEEQIERLTKELNDARANKSDAKESGS